MYDDDGPGHGTIDMDPKHLPPVYDPDGPEHEEPFARLEVAKDRKPCPSCAACWYTAEGYNTEIFHGPDCKLFPPVIEQEEAQ